MKIDFKYLRMKRIFLLFFFMFSLLMAVSAQSDMMIHYNMKGFYLEHNVQKGESFYALGRKYNVSPKSIAEFNDLDYNKGIFIDQRLLIPLTDDNFDQKGNSGSAVFYKAKENETLTTIGEMINNVSPANLRWWNALKTNDVKENTKLIVGFIHSPSLPAVTIAGQPQKEEIIAAVNKEPVKEEKKLEEKKTEEKDSVDPPTKKEEAPPTEMAIDKTKLPKEGFFKYFFEQQIKTHPVTKNETVTAGIFKTVSGWNDAKFYLLIDDVLPGSIVRIINPTTNNTIYAKVLGKMSGIRQNEGLDIRISNAAADALGVQDDNKFIVSINY